MKFKVVETFSGIGSQAKALQKSGFDFEIVNTVEWDINAIYAYDIIHNGPQDLTIYDCMTKEELINKLNEYSLSANGKEPMKRKSLERMPEDSLRRILAAIVRTNNLVDITKTTANDLPNDIDILTYSFPCQDLSISGFWHGNKSGIDRDANNRSSMLWEIERILKEMSDGHKNLPKYLVMENVTNIRSKRHLPNFEEWCAFLKNLGYHNVIYDLKATHFGIPQNRTRTFMLSIYVGSSSSFKEAMLQYLKLNDLKQYNDSNRKKELSDLKDYLRLDYSKMQYRIEAKINTPNDTKSRRKIFEENPHLVDSKGVVSKDIVRTITTKQDRHPNSGVIIHNLEMDGKSAFRYLTPRECFMLMGFDEDDYQNLVDANFKVRKNGNFLTNEKLIKLAGNSIVVDVLAEIFNLIKDVEKLR